MSHVADSPKNRHFEPISGRFTPIRPQIIAASGMGYPLLGTRETWVAPNADHGFHRLFKYLMVA